MLYAIELQLGVFDVATPFDFASDLRQISDFLGMP
jgi:hypothetical protein